MSRLALAFVSLILIGYLLSCQPFLEELAVQQINESYTRNTLIHISISEPKGWKLGPENVFQMELDFPYVASTSDFAIFSHLPSRSSIFVSYKPLLGISYFSGDPKNIADWFKEAHLKVYKTKKEWVELTDGSVDLYTKEIAGRTFYVVKNEIFVSSNLRKEKRAVYIFLHIPEDMRSLCRFCFSTTVQKNIEESIQFQDIIRIISGFKVNQIDSYNEALYRINNSLWMGPQDAKWFNAIKDDCIEDLKNVIAIRPQVWEPRYELAEKYASHYLLTDKEEESLSEVERKAIRGWINVWGKMVPFSPHPINAGAAIREYKEVIKLGCPKKRQNEIETKIKKLQKQ